MPSTPATGLENPPNLLEYIDRASPKDLTDRDLFASVKDQLIEKIKEDSWICKLHAKDRLYLRRDGADYLYVIIDGYIVIFAPSRFSPDDETLLAWRGPEQIIGEMKRVGAEPSSARITAYDSCLLLEIRLDTLDEVARNDPQIYLNINNLLQEKMVWERHRADVIRSTSHKQRIAQALIYLAEERCLKDVLDRRVPVEIPGTIPQGELAQYIGVVRRTVNKYLREFKDGGVISKKRSNRGTRFTIENLEELEKIAQDSDEPNQD